LDQPVAGQQTPRILLVEDDSALRGALAFALGTEGFTVETFACAEDLLASPVAGDCMVVDLKMPGLDGLALIGELRLRGNLTPAILITTNPDARSRRAARAAAVEIVEKPLLTGELRRRIDELVAGDRA